MSSEYDIIANAIAEFYKNPAITTYRSPIHDGDSKYKQIPDNFSLISGHTNLNIILRKASDFYSARKIEPTKNEVKEIADIKKDIPILSNRLSKLEILSKNQDPEILLEYQAIKLKHDDSLKRLGELTLKKEVCANTDKLSIISKAFKILSNHKNVQQATNLYSLIYSKLNKTQVQKVVQQKYDSESDYEDTDTVTNTVEHKFYSNSNNKFNLLQDPIQINIEELIKKYQNGNYMIPSHKKLVEDELAKRKAQADAMNYFPELVTKQSSIPQTNKTSYASIISTSPIEVKTETKVSEQVSENKIPGVTLLKNTLPKYTLIKKEDLGYLTRCTYQYIDDKNKIHTDTFLCANRKFHQAMNRQNLYNKYINEKQYKPWTRCFTFDEWLEWQDEVKQIEEKERFVDLDYESEDEYYDNDEYESNYDFQDEDESNRYNPRYVSNEY